MKVRSKNHVHKHLPLHTKTSWNQYYYWFDTKLLYWPPFLTKRQVQKLGKKCLYQSKSSPLKIGPVDSKQFFKIFFTFFKIDSKLHSPSSCGKDSSLFSSKSRVFSFFSLPMLAGSFCNEGTTNFFSYQYEFFFLGTVIGGTLDKIYSGRSSTWQTVEGRLRYTFS